MYDGKLKRKGGYYLKRRLCREMGEKENGGGERVMCMEVRAHNNGESGGDVCMGEGCRYG